MFKRVVNYKGFWKGVLLHSCAFLVIQLLVFWVGANFSTDFFRDWSLKIYVFLLLASGIAGFGLAYSIFWRKLKEQDYRDKR
ncbi:MAG: hypothetical protein CMC70_09975 [Flavobacteriaceae bacterium]|nr:hypothetical protein [Flavobacteriaceae bacterium]|tara:strand:+ start:527 stop:772 length:246 start_codon:yes stop_codon:yes gene_type:complete